MFFIFIFFLHISYPTYRQSGSYKNPAIIEPSRRRNDLDSTGRFADGAQVHLPRTGREQPLHALRPFDSYNALLLEQFVKADRLKIISPGGTIRIQMIHGQPAGVVDV
jgi:hypothetical protein